MGMSIQAELPDLPPAVNEDREEAEGPEGRGRARLLEPDRTQAVWDVRALDGLLVRWHPARTVWKFVTGLDLTALKEEVRAVEGRAGRPAIDPAVLLALWLYGLSNDVRSSRELAELCKEHDAYRWLCGGVSVSYHTLSDFRSQSEIFDKLLTQTLAVLMKEGILKVERVAQDGMRIRASAGASSFRTRESLAGYLAEAKVRVERAKVGDTRGRVMVSERQKEADKRAAEEQERRAKRALELMPQAEEAMAARPEKKRKGEARRSTTDPEARVMKMADGGFRPAYNGEFATDTETTIILGVEAVNVGSDMGQLPAMLDQLEKRLGSLPKEMLVDGGFPSAETIDDAEARGITLYAPVPRPRGTDTKRDRYEPVAGDSPAKVNWRKRMSTDEAQAIYRLRAATAELVNARLRRYGLAALTVRGLRKVRAMLLLSALTHNLFRTEALRAAA
jgi:transposase